MTKHFFKNIERFLLLSIIVYFSIAFNNTLLAQTGDPEDVFKGQINEKFKPRSPNAASFENASQLPTNLCTGTASMVIPIFKIQGKKLSLPISLNYESKGIKVEEDASWVGLGWRLEAGGVIMQQIQGLREIEILNNNLSPERAPIYDSQVSDYYIEPYLTGIYSYPMQGVTTPPYAYSPHYLKDPGADIFNYNFCGLAGKFALKADKTPIFSPKKNYKFDFNSKTITDDQGNKYTFGILETTWSSETESSTDYLYSWYLTKIVSADGIEEINLSYAVDHQTHAGNIKADGLVDNDGLHLQIGAIPISGIDVARLTEINTNFGIKVKFVPEDLPRTDLSPSNNIKALKNIEIYENNIFLKNFVLEKEYIKSINEVPAVLPPYSSGLLSSTDYINYRLYLKKIKEYNNNQNQNIQSYTFDYFGRTSENKDSLPHKFSYAQDHWGFYNGQLNNNGLCPGYIGEFQDYVVQHVYPWASAPVQINAPNANRESNFLFSRCGTLKKITYPTGGSLDLIYEPHTFTTVEISNPAQSTSGEAGGVRIQKQILFDPVSAKNIITEYSYMYGRVCNGVYDNYVVKNDEGFLSYYSSIPTHTGGTWGHSNIRVSANSMYNLFSYNGSHIMYSSVTEKQNGNGHSTYYFSTPFLGMPNQNDFLRIKCTSNTLTVSDNARLNMTPPFPYGFGWGTPPPISYDWEYGRLLLKQQYKESGEIVGSEATTYNLDGTLVDTIMNVNVNIYQYENEEAICYGGSGGGCDYTSLWIPYFYYYKYPTFLGTSVVTQTSNTIYSGTNSLENISNVSYNSKLQPSVVTLINSDGSKSIKKYKYPYEYDFNCGSSYSDEVAAIKKMVEFNMISEPIEVQELIERGGVQSLVQSTVITYQIIGNGVYPKTTFKVETNSPLSDITQSSTACINNIVSLTMHPAYRARSQYLQYDNGNLVEYQQVNGVKQSLLWGIGSQKPLAVVTGADYSTIHSLVNQALLDDPISSDQDKRNELNKIRTALSGTKALVSTYTYDPVNGLTSETDPSGRTIFYEYDSFGRLSLIKDQDGNIIKKFCYNYAGQVENCQ